jgi:predicted branched-subunit amino acid permease
LLLAIPVIDQLHFTCIPRFERGDLDQRGRRLYYVGAAGWLAGAWLMAQVLAVAVGARLPEAAGLRVAAPLAMAGLLARTLPDRRSAIAAVAAAVLAVVGAGLPLHSTVLVAAVGGMLAGSFVPVDRGRS